MKTLSDFLDMAKTVTGSDYKTAQALKLSRSAISHARKSGSLDADNAVELAKLIDASPAEIVAACNIAKHPENAPFWAKFSAAFFCACALILGSASNEINALESNTYTQNQAANKLNQTIYYANIYADC